MKVFLAGLAVAAAITLGVVGYRHGYAAGHLDGQIIAWKEANERLERSKAEMRRVGACRYAALVQTHYDCGTAR